ncbi:hypothetical protein K469DRAFT_392042 [Zopfia rhizophila CBS 207.26]|uniref:Uncharacterized protein n=1 Tax=Zopfia rhizophila CBS 207.26 TaxID=1314779 RepID=A0A6A6EKX6_9PEZI|nr:hypothetical protein K469DRAFT_392042 [Zopfia rhizophila CBS 207.26]
MEQQDYREDDECDTFAIGPVEISYDSSLLAITKPNRYVEDQNELSFSLKFWDKSLNITPTANLHDGPINDMQNIESVDFNHYSKHSSTPPPPQTFQKINTTHDTDLTYSFSGYRNHSIYPQPLKLNYSQCETVSIAEYLGHIPGPRETRSNQGGINVTDFPTVSARFDNGPASLEITGTYRGNSVNGKQGATSFIGGSDYDFLFGELLMGIGVVRLWRARMIRRFGVRRWGFRRVFMEWRGVLGQDKGWDVGVWSWDFWNSVLAAIEVFSLSLDGLFDVVM